MLSISNVLNREIKIRTCRICLDTKNVDMVLLNEDNGWLNQFEYCFGITLTTKDEPRLLCRLCADNVENYVQFKKKCQQSHALWQSAIYDEKCCIVKHNVENINENVDNLVTQKTEFRDASFDACFDSDSLNYSYDDVVDATANLLHSEIKNENAEPAIFMDEKEIKIENDEPAIFMYENNKSNGNNIKEIKLIPKDNDGKSNFTNLHRKDCLDTNGVDAKKKNSKKVNSINARTNIKNVYTCKKCSKDYESKACYLTHLNTCQKNNKKRKYDPDYAYDCGRNYNCDNISKIKNEYQSDNDCSKEINKSLTQDNSLHLCGLCKLSFNSPKDVCQHLKEHWSSNSLACGLCDFVGIDLAAIAAHRFSHYPRNVKTRFLCHICEQTKLSLLALHFHYRLKHLKKVGGYCSRCNREFTKLRAWKKHERTHSTPGYICDICGKKFYFKHCIKQHVMTHMQLKRCICDICGNFFSRSSYLKVHMKAVHTKAGPMKCSHCNRMFKSEFSLTVHQKIVAKKKTVKCEVCHKEFATNNMLQSHMVMHSSERPHCCDICGASYKAKCHLKVHMRKHTGFFPFKCLHCTKAFASSSQLKVHSSVHTGVRRHSCVVPNCVRTFHSKKLMLAHLALRHKNENVIQK